jgi:ABC-type dipeptide/oligopeptide/nickel transport system permease component
VRASLLAFLIRRVAAALVFVAVVSTATFTLTRLVPGDATTEMYARGADAATIARERARLGLDRPFTEQLTGWMGGLAHFDLGMSWKFRRPVRGLIAERAPATAMLAAVALLLGTLIGVPLGILTGARPRGWLAMIVAPLSVALVACPPLVGALGLLLLAATTGWLSIASGSLGVPALALALPLAALLERVQSQATRDALTSPDLLATAARGVPPARLLWIHAARQSLRPVLGIYGIVIGSLFSGSFIVEIVTAWPGLGQLMYGALVGRDLYLVAGCAMVGAICIAAGNLFADIVRACVDPRVQEQL